MKNSITVYYASPDNLQETQDWSILYKEPKSLNNYLLDNLNKNRNKDVLHFRYCLYFHYEIEALEILVEANIVKTMLRLVV